MSKGEHENVTNRIENIECNDLIDNNIYDEIIYLNRQQSHEYLIIEPTFDDVNSENAVLANFNSYLYNTTL